MPDGTLLTLTLIVEAVVTEPPLIAGLVAYLPPEVADVDRLPPAKFRLLRAKSAVNILAEVENAAIGKICSGGRGRTAAAKSTAGSDRD